ncbi:hypothetical protein PR048_030680 [Dryococelus australis]|uniref:Uncharacterized protein n=1 Tax=Dryococelus australis TaxID=614101 RepID=A0ABQ9GDG1_9NEOP|nr:hypothetical protein PR048_030680 [Dryococelus australis]
MHYFYCCIATGNGHCAAAFYAEHLRRREGQQPERYPDRRMFTNPHNTFMEIRMPGPRCEGIPRADPGGINQVLEEVHTEPSASIRKLSSPDN